MRLYYVVFQQSSFNIANIPLEYLDEAIRNSRETIILGDYQMLQLNIFLSEEKKKLLDRLLKLFIIIKLCWTAIFYKYSDIIV